MTSLAEDLAADAFISDAIASTTSTTSSSTPLSVLLGRTYGHAYQRMTPFERHQRFIHDYSKHYGPAVTDHDLLRKEYRFVRTASDDQGGDAYEKRLARRYYDKLYREYCLADMSRYRTGQLGLRWRTKAEVMSGKGQFVCGGTHCHSASNLRSFEVNFAYVEEGKRMQELVKVRVCDECAYKLNYHREKTKRRRRKTRTKSKYDDDDSGDDSGDDDDVTKKKKRKSK